MRFLSNLDVRKMIGSRFIYVAISQLCGLISFTIVAKFLLASSEMQTLASYQGLQAITAFLMMSIQYSNSRSRIFGIKFAIFFLAIYAGAVIFLLGGKVDFRWSICTVVTFASACYSNLILTAIKKFNVLLIFQIVCSALLPFSIVFPLLAAAFFLILLTALLINFRSLIFALSDMHIFQDGKNWLSSLSMQAPLVLLPIFDPLLVQLVGSEVYRSYALATKYCAGPINLVFSTAQFKVLEKSIFNGRKLKLYCTICFASVVFLVGLEAHLILQVLSLIVFINFASLIVRINNMRSTVWWSFLVGPAALGCYYLFLKTSGVVYAGIGNYFVAGILFCIAFNVLFSMIAASCHARLNEC